MSTIFTLRPEARLDNIVLYHDYLCPWCYVGWIQARKLRERFDIAFDWVGAELWPPELAWPTPRPAAPVDPNATPPPPPAPSRFDRFCEIEEIKLPSPRPGRLRTHHALLGAEWAKAQGPAAFDAYNDAVYAAYWERCENIEDVPGLAALAAAVGLDGAALTESVAAERFGENILHFDDPVYAVGIRHVPTFLFGAEELLSEAHYDDLAHAAERFLLRTKRP